LFIPFLKQECKVSKQVFISHFVSRVVMDQRTAEKRIRMQHLHQDPEGVQAEDLETLPLIEDLQRGNRQVIIHKY
jgi:hypothetical protein